MQLQRIEQPLVVAGQQVGFRNAVAPAAAAVADAEGIGNQVLVALKRAQLVATGKIAQAGVFQQVALQFRKRHRHL
ncbi:hypothetical protein DDQ68_02415 [Hymenobacter nivis]|uniref:Uncharacterized protein n=1 Tax=Hymenobacter nivis TaxID=1850093 RepID=A0A2Z3GJ40_9BACT|nr:hypothetical protein DDQ68_02415 [Hymenobacter nivis]